MRTQRGGFVELTSVGKQEVFKEIDHRSQQIGDEQAQQNRLHDVQELSAEAQKDLCGEEGVVHKHDGTDGQKDGDSPLDMGFFVLHRHLRQKTVERESLHTIRISVFAADCNRKLIVL